MSEFYHPVDLLAVKSTPRWSDLLFLRGQRDSMAKSLGCCASHEEHVENMMKARYASSAYQRLRADFYDRHFHSSLDRLDVFREFCERIAELEEEALPASSSAKATADGEHAECAEGRPS